MRRTPLKPGKGFQRKPSRIPAAVIAESAKNCAEMLDANLLARMVEQDREARLEARAARQIASALETMGMVTANVVMVAGPATSGIAIEKERAVSYEPYRRLVAELPCMWCGVSGYSQHAHLNRGKGMGLKTDDRTGFPLCCSRPGIEGCHVAYDQYRLIEGADSDLHHEYGLEWGRITRHTILTAGLWPKPLPLFED
ncbi:MAG: hypothetical protein RSG22_18305 [Comamonas sp.]